MFGFGTLGLLLLLQIATVVQIIHRLFLIIRTPKSGGKRWKTATPEMKAWRLSAVEPIVTTTLTMVLTIPALILAMPLRLELEKPSLLSVLITLVPILSMLFYSWRINKYGEGRRLARLAVTVIGMRVVLLSVSAYFYIQLSRLFSELTIVIAPIVCAFLIRTVFTVYQNLVIDKMDVDASRKRMGRTTTLIEDNELWDEQIALIERLKAEEEHQKL